MQAMHQLSVCLLKAVKKPLCFARNSPCIVGIVVFAVALAAGWNFCMQRAVHVQIRLSAPISGGVQVYYCDNPDSWFSEGRCICVQPIGTPAVANVAVPVRQLGRLRLDFGSAPGDFTMLGGMVGDVPLPSWNAWSFSPDVTVKSSGGESGELKLFSDRADPYMYVSFRSPIRASSLILNRSRFGLVSMLPFALVLVLVTIRFLAQRPGANSQRSSERVRAAPSWFYLMLAMSFFFVVGVRMALCGCDMGFHTAIADGINFKDLLCPLEFWKQHFYPLWHLLVKLVKTVFQLEKCRVASGLVNGLCYNACLIGVYVFLRRHFKSVDSRGLIGVAFAVCTVGCMFGPWLDIQYLYENTHNSWHNPTSAMVKTLALPCALLTARWFNRASDPDARGGMQWTQVMVLGLLLVLTELAKPSFIQVYLPAMLLFLAGWFFVKRGRTALAAVQFFLVLLVPCLVLLAQYMLVFGSSESEGGIGFGCMVAVGSSVINLFYAVAFPVVALIIAIQRRKVHTEDVLCWLMLLVGTAMRLFLFERGLRMTHGNLAWGYGVALYLVWAVSVRQYVDVATSQDSVWSRLGFRVLSILLILHLVTGFYKIYIMACLGRAI